MRLDVSHLRVESFSTVSPIEPTDPVDTGRLGPESLCYICYETGNTVPTCGIGCTFFYPCPYPETIDAPCTNQQTCVGCA